MSDDVRARLTSRSQLPEFEPAGVERSADELSQEVLALRRMLFLLVQRLDGRVEFGEVELASLDPVWELVSWTDPVTLGLVAKCRKPPKEQQ